MLITNLLFFKHLKSDDSSHKNIFVLSRLSFSLQELLQYGLYRTKSTGELLFVKHQHYLILKIRSRNQEMQNLHASILMSNSKMNSS